MKFGKLLATGLAAVTLLGTATTTVSAARMQLTKKSYIFNSKGKKTKLFYRKGKKVKVLSTKKIKGKKFYKIGKNKYVLFKNLKKKKAAPKPVAVPKPVVPQKPQEPAWTSKHIVDTLPSLTDQIKKALTLSGEDRLEADKEIAVKLGMSPKSVTESTQSSFEQKLQSYVGSADSAKNWIEQGGR